MLWVRERPETQSCSHRLAYHQPKTKIANSMPVTLGFRPKAQAIAYNGMIA